MRYFVFIVFCCCYSSYAQTIEKDTLSSMLDEIEINARAQKKIETNLKKNVSVDEFLAASHEISFIKKGAYAWEPLLNNMSTERTSVTIDGMHVFGACTDKMDPITTYVESNGLATIDIKSGQEGGTHGATVSGSIDLKRKQAFFSDDATWNGAYQSGFEFNNKQFFNLANASFSDAKWGAQASVAHRKATDYKDGNNQVVNHSQYEKFNSSVGLAFKTSKMSSIHADALFDVAKNVGYPALPMDLWLSRALITSVGYQQLWQNKAVASCDFKVYFNAIEHYMDDTTRPENKVHMDMPGWSTTYGLVSNLKIEKSQYTADLQLNAYQNTSIAEMRMYPQDRSERTMFAYSWPWITTRYAGASMNNTLQLSKKSTLLFGASLGWHYNQARYIDFNWIFHPGAPQEKTRFLPSLYANYMLNVNHFQFSVGSGYGHRAPSVSEGYGYYIYNSFDRYDYIGNPNLKSEISYEGNASAGFIKDNFSFQVKANYFYLQHYIIGRVLSLGSPMNYQSVGVKGYEALNSATLFNVTFLTSYNITDHLHAKASLTYARSKDNKNSNLPFIRPLSYQASLHYQLSKLAVQVSFQGDAAQRNFGPEYGEDHTPAYAIWNVSANYTFYIKQVTGVFQVGVENVGNKAYSTYADWGNIPRMGRNVFTSLKINF